MSKHTPGPWRVFSEGRKNPGIEAKSSTIVLYGDDDEDCGIRGEDSEEQLANARLIAAAPELLEALKELVADAKAKLIVFGKDFGILNSSELAACIDEAKKAILKADGRP